MSTLPDAGSDVSDDVIRCRTIGVDGVAESGANVMVTVFVDF
jgi:hypothetical protein